MQNLVTKVSRCALSALLSAGVFFMFGCSGDGTSTPAAATPPPVASAPVTWFVPDSTTLNTAQAANFDTGQLYFNVQSAANSTGEIRGGITPSLTVNTLDGGDPFAANPSNAPVTFSAILGGDQVRPRNVVSSAKGYGSVTLDPVSKKISGFIVTSGIFGTAANIFDGLPGSNGSIGIPLEGGPVVWTVPANMVLTDTQIARLSAGAFYYNVNSEAFPEGELRGQLDQQVRCASLTGASETPPVTTSASGVGFLAMKASTKQFSGFIKVSGLSSTVQSVFLESVTAGPTVTPVATLQNSGNGIWVITTTLSDVQVANFNNNELYFNVHTVNNPGGEVRGQLLKSTVKIGTAVLNGAKEVPPVASQGTGTGTVALNVLTGQLNGSMKTDKISGTVAQIHSGSPTATGPAFAGLSTTSPVTVVPVAGISFALDIQPIFTASCSGIFCHVTGGIAPMSLQPDVAYANVLIRVVPGNSTSSLLIQRLTGVILPQMPLAGPPLSTSSLNLIKAWIDNGAINN